MIRIGIRQLLQNRLKEINLRDSQATVDDLLRATRAQPIAVVPKAANDQHYEVPAEFFDRVLGYHRKYSCGYWQTGASSLDQAEEAALRITCENANLEDGMNVLELGCGWGSLSLWMAKHYPRSQITAISNSQSQRQFIQRRAAEHGLTNLNVITADINHFQPDGSFDRVVSVEMFEHMRNHHRLIQQIADWLRPGGKLFVHIFCHKQTPYLFRSDGEQNWMGRYFFTGGMMPSADLLPKCCEPLQLISQWKWSGINYAKTCRAWLDNQDAAKDLLLPILSKAYKTAQPNRWHNRWRLFFMACEELFAFDNGQEWFVCHYLFERNTKPDYVQ